MRYYIRDIGVKCDVGMSVDSLNQPRRWFPSHEVQFNIRICSHNCRKRGLQKAVDPIQIWTPVKTAYEYQPLRATSSRRSLEAVQINAIFNHIDRVCTERISSD